MAFVRLATINKLAGGCARPLEPHCAMRMSQTIWKF